MPSYEIIFARSARKELQALQSDTAERILAKIELLVTNPRPPNSKKLRGIGEYRAIYSVDDKNHIVDVSVIRHRSEAYR
jgi:mRNA interferase RelE/StbE